MIRLAVIHQLHNATDSVKSAVCNRVGEVTRDGDNERVRDYVSLQDTNNLIVGIYSIFKLYGLQ